MKDNIPWGTMFFPHLKNFEELIGGNYRKQPHAMLICITYATWLWLQTMCPPVQGHPFTCSVCSRPSWIGNKSAMLIESEKKHIDQYIYLAYLVNKGNHPKMALILVSEIL
jgi:hypothetical protein